MADSDFKSQVLGATDIVALIGQSVSLKRRGKNYVGLCPFHQERTPSFNVDPVKGYFKCFGCKASGNAIDFVMKRDRLDFLEAMKSLGEAAGLEMPKFGMSKAKTSERQTLLELHSKAADFYHRTLLGPLGVEARAYLTKRGFTAETLTKFRVGFAPMGWDNLLRSKDMAGANPGLMALGGLVKPRQNGGGHYDTFRNRIMFPIRDEQGRVIAFGGRVMPGSDDPAKYLNSPETPLFNKSKAAFGLDLGRDRVVETRTVAVVEGYTDVAMAHQFGATNVVSILGTALTEQHIQLLRRFADRVVLLFDADTAGETAVNRAVELFLTQPIEIAIASIPEGLDPDEFLLKFGREALDDLLKTAADALTFKWKLLDREVKASGDSLTQQQRALEAYLGLLSQARSQGGGAVDEIRWGAVLRRVERLTGVPMENLQRRFPQSRQPARPTYGRPPPRPVESSSTSDLEHRTSDSAPPVEGVDPARIVAERWILGILLAEPGRWLHLQKEVDPSSFLQPAHRALAEFYWDRQRNEGEPTFSELLGELRDDAQRELATELLEESEKLGDLEATVKTVLHFFTEERRRRQEQAVRHRLLNSGHETEEEEQLKQLQALQKLARNPDLRRGGLAGT